MKIHLIGIGGAAMHNLAICLKLNGHEVSGSDARIFDPARSRLAQYQLLPEREEYDAARITDDINVVILGMAMFPDNPERIRAKELGLKIMSFPEFIYNQSKNKKRLVIGGSHGKTTTTGMVMHVLKHQGISFDRLVGSVVEGFEAMVGLSDAPIIVIEGDEYPDSKINLIPKFLVYGHTIGVLNGIARDHVNIYDTWEKYVDVFRKFVTQTPSDGKLYYNADDQNILKLMEEFKNQHNLLPYHQHEFNIIDGKYFLKSPEHEVPVEVIGEHNMTNIMAAKMMCLEAGVSEQGFYQAIRSFQPALNRLNLIHDTPSFKVYRDFAHSPSKLHATTQAVKSLYPDKTVVAVYELHTYSALNKGFLTEYKGQFNHADYKIVYFNPQAVAHKKLPELSYEDVIDGFADPSIRVTNNKDELQSMIQSFGQDKIVLLLMSSGDFGGMNIDQII